MVVHEGGNVLLILGTSNTGRQVCTEVTILTSAGFIGAQQIGGGFVLYLHLSNRDTGVIVNVNAAHQLPAVWPP